MDRRFRPFVLLLAPLVGAGALGLYESAGSRVLAQPRLVAQPAYWVPFSAELKRIFETDGSVFVGRYYRATNGSTRADTGRSFDALDNVTIKNIPAATFYRWTPETGWTSQPMDLPPGGWRPMATIFNDRMSEVSELVEGFRLIKVVHTGGRVSYQAPDLNLFTLVLLVPCKFDPAASCGTWHSNIVTGEPPASYFSPTPGAPITKRNELGGILWYPSR
jgi:hypothetical protein